MTVKLIVDLTVNGNDQLTGTFQKISAAASKTDADVQKTKTSAAAMLTAMSTSYLALKDILESVAHLAEAPILSAVQAEAANVRLSATLLAVGKYSDDAFESVKDYAKQLSALSGTSQEVVKSVIEQNLAMGMSVTQAELATKAAAGLAKVSHQDLVGANESFLAALEGQTKGLKKWIDGVDALTDASLRSGAAYEMGLGKLSKFITSDSGSTEGALKRLGNALHDLSNEAGMAFLAGADLPGQYTDLKRLIDQLSTTVEDARPAFEKLGAVVGGGLISGITSLTDTVKILIPYLPTMATQLYDVTKIGLLPFAMAALEAARAFEILTGHRDAANAINEVIKKMGVAFVDASKDLRNWHGAAKENELTQADWDKFLATAAFDSSVNSFVANAEEKKGFLTRFFEGWAADIRKSFGGHHDLLAPDKETLANQFGLETRAPVNVSGFGASGSWDGPGGSGPAAAPMQAGASLGELRSQDDTHNEAEKYGKIHKELSKQQIQERDQMLRQLHEMTVAAQQTESNELIAAYNQRESKVEDLEKQAAVKGFSIAKGTAELRDAMLDELLAKMKIQYSQDQVTFATAMGNQTKIAEATYNEQTRLFSEMVHKGRMERDQADLAEEHSASTRLQSLYSRAQEIATLEGQTTNAIEAEYEKRNEALIDLFQQGEIEYEAYLTALAVARRKADEDESKTTGDATVDDKAQKVVTTMGAVKDGVNSTIALIGQMYGPIGTIVAGIIQTLNMTPAAFRAMLDGLDNMWAQLLPNILTNITILIEHFPTTLMRIFSQWGNVNMWEGFLQGLKVAFTHLFTNLWKEIFTGGRLDEDLSAAVDSAKKISFGNNDPNAGDNAFKIKDVSGTQAQTVTDAAQVFGGQVAESTKGLLYYFSDAWHNLLALMSTWFTENLGKLGSDLWHGMMEAAGQATADLKFIGAQIWSAILELFKEATASMQDFGQKIFDGFTGALNKGAAALAPIFNKFGSAISDGLNAAIGLITKTFTGLGASISDGFKSALDANAKLQTTITGFGAKIWSGLTSAIDTGKFSDLGSKVWDGLKAQLDNAILSLKYFEYIGTNIWNGLKNGLGAALDIFTNLGTTIWNGLKAGLSSVSSGGGSLKIGGVSVPGIEHGGMILSNGLQSEHLASAFASMGAMKFEGGGTVPGTGFRDSVPAVLRGGEVVQTPEQVRAGSSPTVVFNFNIAAGAPKVDRQMVRDELMPQVMEFLNRESRNGKNILRGSGVY